MCSAECRRQLHVLVAHMQTVGVFGPFDALELQIVAVDVDGVGAGLAAITEKRLKRAAAPVRGMGRIAA